MIHTTVKISYTWSFQFRLMDTSLAHGKKSKRFKSKAQHIRIHMLLSSTAIKRMFDNNKV